MPDAVTNLMISLITQIIHWSSIFLCYVGLEINKKPKNNRKQGGQTDLTGNRTQVLRITLRAETVSLSHLSYSSAPLSKHHIVYINRYLADSRIPH